MFGAFAATLVGVPVGEVEPVTVELLLQSTLLAASVVTIPGLLSPPQ